MALSWPFKDPDEVLDYQVDWSARLGEDDEIVSSIWEVPSGINKDSDSRTTSTTTIWLSGGVVGQTYELMNRIETVGNRTMDQTIKLKIKVK